MLSTTKLKGFKFPLASNTAAIRSVTNFSLFDVVKSVAKLQSPLYRFAATTAVTTSTTETTLVTYTVPPTYNATDLLKLVLSLRTKNDSGSAVDFTLKVKVDGTAVATSVATIADATASNYGKVDFEMFHNRTSTLCSGLYTVGSGDDVAISSTAGFTLAAGSVITVTLQMSASDAQAQFELLGGYAKVID